MSSWDKLWMDPDKRTNYLTLELLKNVKAEGDHMQKKLKAIKTLCKFEANIETRTMFARKNLAKDILRLLEGEA